MSLTGSKARSRKAKEMKSLKEKWEKSVQSMGENGENEIGGSSTVTVMRLMDNC